MTTPIPQLAAAASPTTPSTAFCALSVGVDKLRQRELTARIVHGNLFRDQRAAAYNQAPEIAANFIRHILDFFTQLLEDLDSPPALVPLARAVNAYASSEEFTAIRPLEAYLLLLEAAFDRAEEMNVALELARLLQKGDLEDAIHSDPSDGFVCIFQFVAKHLGVAQLEEPLSQTLAILVPSRNRPAFRRLLRYAKDLMASSDDLSSEFWAATLTQVIRKRNKFHVTLPHGRDFSEQAIADIWNCSKRADQGTLPSDGHDSRRRRLS